MLATAWRVRIRRLLRQRLGLDLLYARPGITDVLAQQRIDTVLDVGANVGQYGLLLRSWGYRGRIVSFEPLSAQFRELKDRAARDGAWEAHHCGLGDADTTATINVSDNTVYSSILQPKPELHSFDSRSATVRSEEITVRRLDSLLPEVRGSATNLYLKVDTQGYERQVLAGAGSTLESFKGIQLELSETPMYTGEASFLEMTSLLAGRGFKIGLLLPFAHDPATRFLIQSDVVFVPN